MAKTKQTVAEASMKVGRKRLAGMISIDPKLDLQGNVSVVAVSKFITSFSDAINHEHELESELRKLKVQIDTMTGRMDDYNQRMLSGVGTRFGFDSESYELVGGVRKSKRKKPVRKAGAAPKAKAAGKVLAAPPPATEETPATEPSSESSRTTPAVNASIVVTSAPSAKPPATVTNGATNGTANGASHAAPHA